jgi:hypothetical protein
VALDLIEVIVEMEDELGNEGFDSKSKTAPLNTKGAAPALCAYVSGYGNVD